MRRDVLSSFPVQINAGTFARGFGPCSIASASVISSDSTLLTLGSQILEDRPNLFSAVIWSTKPSHVARQSRSGYFSDLLVLPPRVNSARRRGLRHFALKARLMQGLIVASRAGFSVGPSSPFNAYFGS
eukprot:1043941-Pyramimonas_sp.AAC.1